MSIKKMAFCSVATFSFAFSGLFGIVDILTTTIHASEGSAIDSFYAPSLLYKKDSIIYVDSIDDNAPKVEKNKIIPEQINTEVAIKEKEKSKIANEKVASQLDRYKKTDKDYYISKSTNVMTSDNEESDIVTSIDYGDYVKCIGEDIEKKSEWCKISVGDNEGFIKKSVLTEDVLFKSVDDIVYVKDTIDVYGDVKLSDVIATFNKNQSVNVVGESNDLYKISYGDEYVYANKSNFTSNIPTYNRGNNVIVPTTNTGNRSDVVNIALSYAGYPYVWGGTSPSGFDCSGFTQYVYSRIGISINRTAEGQLSNGSAVSLDGIAPGDLILWSGSRNGSITHVSMYIGNGQMIHAANPSQGVIIGSVNDYITYGGSIVGIRRI